MSTIYSWAAEYPADTTGASSDWMLVYDTSTGFTKKARIGSVFTGGAAAKVLGFYGAAGVNQGTFTATAVTALATATISEATTATVFGFASSTAAIAYAKRMSQIQADLKLLMQKVDSTGLLDITGV